jgi:hypothetical protein
MPAVLKAIQSLCYLQTFLGDFVKISILTQWSGNSGKTLRGKASGYRAAKSTGHVNASKGVTLSF